MFMNHTPIVIGVAVVEDIYLNHQKIQHFSCVLLNKENTLCLNVTSGHLKTTEFLSLDKPPVLRAIGTILCLWSIQGPKYRAKDNLPHRLYGKIGNKLRVEI